MNKVLKRIGRYNNPNQLQRQAHTYTLKRCPPSAVGHGWPLSVMQEA